MTIEKHLADLAAALEASFCREGRPRALDDGVDFARQHFHQTGACDGTRARALAFLEAAGVDADTARTQLRTATRPPFSNGADCDCEVLVALLHKAAES